jgi:hypothetical protein
MGTVIPVSCVPLNHPSYSPTIQKKISVVLSKLFKSAASPDFDLNLRKMLIQGHTLWIGTKRIEFTLGSKKVFIQNWDGSKDQVDENFAKELRVIFKELVQHADDLGLVSGSDRSDASPKKIIPNQPSSSLTEKIQSKGYPIADVIGILRNLIDLAQIIATIEAVTSWLATATATIGSMIAALRLVQGSLSILLGSIKLVQAVKLYNESQKNHDADGLAIARRQIIGALLSIGEGVVWITLGMLFLSCPQLALAISALALAITILQYLLFYGGFTTDFIVSILTAHTTMKSLQNHYRVFETGILNNPNLSLEEKKSAARRFMERMMRVTPEEEAKIREKCTGNPASIQKRLEEKLSKKKAIMSRFGITDQLFADPKADLLTKMQEQFDQSVREQEAQQLLSIICLVVNAIGVPLDLSGINIEGIGKACRFLLLGVEKSVWAATITFGWIGVNGLYLLEDAFKLVRKIFPKKIAAESDLAVTRTALQRMPEMSAAS